MVNKDKRIRIITGHYGSGKSEVAVNYVVQLRKETEDKVALADLDVVNVYFRSRERKEGMRAMGIHPIDSSVDAPCLGLPGVSAEVTTPMNDKSYQYVIDLGGDKVGARVIARFRGSIPDDEYDLFFVVNANRERTQTAEEVMEYIDEIEAALDDANVYRYAQFLKELSKDTQFIVVTHRKGTMESADALYGVTMQESGISSLVSVKLSDNKNDEIAS